MQRQQMTCPAAVGARATKARVSDGTWHGCDVAGARPSLPGQLAGAVPSAGPPWRRRAEAAYSMPCDCGCARAERRRVWMMAHGTRACWARAAASAFALRGGVRSARHCAQGCWVWIGSRAGGVARGGGMGWARGVFLYQDARSQVRSRPVGPQPTPWPPDCVPPSPNPA
jgi:hypothetical protein